MKLLCVLGAALFASLALVGTAEAARCCWKTVASAQGEFSTGWEPRISGDPRDRGRHEFGDVRGASRMRWTWQSRGLYALRELRVGRRTIPVLDAQTRSVHRARLRTRTEYCVIELHYRSGDVVDEECVPPRINPCTTDRWTGWKRGGSGARTFGDSGAYRRLFLGFWGNRPPYDGRCAQFADPLEGPDQHGMVGAWSYEFQAPHSLLARLRGRRSFTLAPGTVEFRAFHGQRPRVAGSHASARGQPHDFGGQTAFRVRFLYVPSSRLRSERRALGDLVAGRRRCTRPSLNVEPPTVDRGAHLMFRGACFRAGRAVTLFLGTGPDAFDRVASARANRSGGFSKRHRIPTTADPGTYDVLACQRSCRTKASARLVIR